MSGSCRLWRLRVWSISADEHAKAQAIYDQCYALFAASGLTIDAVNYAVDQSGSSERQVELSPAQTSVMTLIREHGPLSYSELSDGTYRGAGSAYSSDEVHDAVREIQRRGFVHVVDDQKVHLTAAGRRWIQGVARS